MFQLTDDKTFFVYQGSNYAKSFLIVPKIFDIVQKAIDLAIIKVALVTTTILCSLSVLLFPSYYPFSFFLHHLVLFFFLLPLFLLPFFVLSLALLFFLLLSPSIVLSLHFFIVLPLSLSFSSFFVFSFTL